MSKRKLDDMAGVRNPLYPYLPVLVGANVGGRPNFITIGLVGWLCYDAMSVSVGHEQYTTAGIRENGSFSVNQPTTGLVRELDYCGTYSGRKVDKAALFEVFYGELGNAPMIVHCPLSIECRVIQVMERRVHTVFIGEVVGLYVDEGCLDEGLLDVTRVDPILYAPERRGGKQTGGYWRLGDYLAPAWEVGKELRQAEREKRR